MTGPEAAAYAALYGPTAAEMAQSMADVGSALAAQLDRFSAAPTLEDAEALSRNLEGAARACRRVRERLQLEGGAGGQ